MTSTELLKAANDMRQLASAHRYFAKAYEVSATLREREALDQVWDDARVNRDVPEPSTNH